MHKYSSIIPVFNEASRVGQVLSIVSTMRNIYEVICVDDGSTDNSQAIIQSKFPGVILVRHKKNKGKSYAVTSGLKKAHGDTIILIDGDLFGLKKKDITRAIKLFEHYNFDCLLLCTKATSLFDSFFRLILRLPHCATGTRIIKKSHLTKIVTQLHIPGFALEMAQNRYLLQRNKRVAYMHISATNVHKFRKVGMLHGMREEVVMWSQIMAYIGFRNIIKQFLFFARKKV